MRWHLVLGSAALVLAGTIALGGALNSAAQDATPAGMADHPFVGTWIVDTISESDTDTPEVSIVTPDGQAVGLGANRVAAATWEAVDDRTANLTLVSVFDNAQGAGYVIVRGPHVVDETGDAWTCECTFTLVSADGTVLDSGVAPASARRLPLQGVEMAGQPLAEVPAWVSAMATPAP